ncbi:hypothetical protein Btru_076243 [Bulinus truncatus]|nr:hypothetical protein Btru_076243 [Bulinus truncatus]
MKTYEDWVDYYKGQGCDLKDAIKYARQEKEREDAIEMENKKLEMENKKLELEEKIAREKVEAEKLAAREKVEAEKLAAREKVEAEKIAAREKVEVEERIAREKVDVGIRNQHTTDATRYETRSKFRRCMTGGRVKTFKGRDKGYIEKKWFSVQRGEGQDSGKDYNTEAPSDRTVSSESSSPSFGSSKNSVTLPSVTEAVFKKSNNSSDSGTQFIGSSVAGHLHCDGLTLVMFLAVGISVFNLRSLDLFDKRALF